MYNYKGIWWGEKDSNLRTPKRADLQSAAIDRSAISPRTSPIINIIIYLSRKIFEKIKYFYDLTTLSA